jgi:hypothetical protein
MNIEIKECTIENYKSTQLEEAIYNAEQNGFEVIHSEVDRLLLDLDDDKALRTYEMVLPTVAETLELKEIDRWKSKSGTGIHVVLSCKPLCFYARVALQAALGSDPIRECLTVDRADNGLVEPSVLFKPPEGYVYGNCCE